MSLHFPRVSAILWPITHRSRHGMTRLMLVLAWLLAPLCSLPQVSPGPERSPGLSALGSLIALPANH